MQSISDRAKPLTRTQQARRNDIIQAAITVLDTDGFAAASVDRIAQAAHTSKATVLYHFSTKEAIYDQVVRALYETGRANMVGPLDAATATSGKAMLATYLDTNLRFIAAHKAHVNAVHEILQNRFAAYDLPDGITELSNLLATAQQAGTLGDFDPTVMAFAIRAVIDGFSFHVGHVDLDHGVAQIIDLFTKATK